MMGKKKWKAGVATKATSSSSSNNGSSTVTDTAATSISTSSTPTGTSSSANITTPSSTTSTVASSSSSATGTASITASTIATTSIANPPKLTKGQRRKANSATAQTDDFDNMLAEFHAADLINPPASTAVTVDNTTSSKVKVHEDTIIQCAIAGDTTKLRRWARQGVRVFTAQPLCQAALAGNLDVVKCLIKELGADVSQGAQKGFTALHAAAQGGHTAILLYLVKKLGANVNQANDDGASPLVQAVLLGSLSTVQCLAKDLKADVNQATQEGATPLSIAAQEGHVDIARFLIKECGVDVNQTMMDGTTPLSMAAQQGRVDMIRCLGVEFGADANKCRLDGNSPLYVAASNGRHLDLISCLVKELGADINHAASDGTTPLMMASKNKHAEVVRWLLKYGANAQAQMQYNGKTYNAAIVSKEVRAPAEQTTYLVAKTFCANQVESFSCGDAGRKRCASCEVVFYCGLACQAAHWPVHKTACKQSAGLKASKAK